MSEPLAAVGALTLFVADRQRSRSFYERAFDVTVLSEDEDAVALRFENVILNLLERRAAAELVEPAPVAEPEAGAGLLLTIFVGDADAACARLLEAGVSLLNGPLDRPWGMRTAAFADPDGHVWEVAAPV